MNKQQEMEKFIPKMSPEEFGQFVKEQFAIARPVIYYKRMVDGAGSDPVSTKITSAPWQLGHGEWVCKVDGVAGGVALSHLRFVEDMQGATEEEAVQMAVEAQTWIQNNKDGIFTWVQEGATLRLTTPSISGVCFSATVEFDFQDEYDEAGAFYTELVMAHQGNDSVLLDQRFESVDAAKEATIQTIKASCQLLEIDFRLFIQRNFTNPKQKTFPFCNIIHSLPTFLLDCYEFKKKTLKKQKYKLY